MDGPRVFLFIRSGTLVCGVRRMNEVGSG